MPMDTLREKKSWLMASRRIWRKAPYGQSLKMRGKVVEKTLDTGPELSGLVCMLQSQRIACNDDYENQQNGHHIFGYTLNSTLDAIVYNERVTPMKSRAKTTGATGEVMKEVK